MKNKWKFPSLLKKGGLLIALAALVGSIVAPTVAEAHDAYYLSITMNPDAKQFVGYVSMDDNGNGTSKHAEFANTGAYFLYDKDRNSLFKSNENKLPYKTFTLPSSEWNGDTLSSAYKKYVSQDMEGKDEVLPFSFPGRHVGSTATDNGKIRNGNSLDREQAMWVSSNLVDGLNAAISFVYNDAGFTNGSEKLKDRTIEIATKLANAGAKVVKRNGGSGEKKFDVNGVTFTVADGSDVNGKNKTPFVAASNYLKLHLPNTGEWVYFPWSVSKGYGSSQRIYEEVKGTSYAGYAKQDVSFLSWQHIVLQGAYNSYVNSIEYGSIDKLNEPGFLEQSLAEMLSGMVNGLESFLGLHSMSELMLNRGSFGLTYWEGVMPKTVSRVADMAFVVMLFIAFLLIAGSFVKLFTMRNLAAINPRMRVELKEGLMDIVGAAFVLIMFIPLFRSAVAINSSFVEMFSGLSVNADKFGTAFSGDGLLSTVILSLAFFVMDIYFNVIYIMRGLTIAALYVFAPLFIVSIAYGGKFKQIFSSFVKELIGALFLQSIHAGILGFYQATIDAGMSGNFLYTFILTLSFIPITAMFKGAILNLGGDAIDSVGKSGGSALGMGGAIAGGAILSGMKGVGSRMTGGSGSSSSGGSGSGGTGINSRFNGGGGGGGGSNQDISSTTMSDNGKIEQSGDTSVNTKFKETANGDRIQRQREGYEGNRIQQMKDTVGGIKDGAVNGAKSVGGYVKESSPKEMLSDMGNLAKKGASAGASAGLELGIKAGKAGAIEGAKTGAALGAAGLKFGVMAGDMATGGSMGISKQMMRSGMHKKMQGGGKFSGGSSSSYTNSDDLMDSIPPDNILNQYEPDKEGEGHLISMQDNETGAITQVHDLETMKESMGVSDIRDVLPSTNAKQGEIALTVPASEMDAMRDSGNDYLDRAMADFKSQDSNLTDKWKRMGINSMYENQDGSVSYFVDKQENGIHAAAIRDNKFVMKRDQRAEAQLPNFKDMKTFDQQLHEQVNFEREKEKPRAQSN